MTHACQLSLILTGRVARYGTVREFCGPLYLRVLTDAPRSSYSTASSSRPHSCALRLRPRRCRRCWRRMPRKTVACSRSMCWTRRPRCQQTSGRAASTHCLRTSTPAVWRRHPLGNRPRPLFLPVLTGTLLCNVLTYCRFCMLSCSCVSDSLSCTCALCCYSECRHRPALLRSPKRGSLRVLCVIPCDRFGGGRLGGSLGVGARCPIRRRCANVGCGCPEWTSVRGGALADHTKSKSGRLASTVDGCVIEILTLTASAYSVTALGFTSPASASACSQGCTAAWGWGDRPSLIDDRT